MIKYGNILQNINRCYINFVLNIYNSNNESNSNSMYKVKRQSDKKEGPTKKSIIENQFGLAT